MAGAGEIRPAIDGLLGPAIPEPEGAALLSLVFQLEWTQWWSRDELAAAQRRQLQALLDHARKTVPFYRGRLPERVEDWADVPILRREDIQDAGDSLLSEKLPDGHGDRRHTHTSGSTGKPVRTVRSQLWELYWSAFTVRDHLWHRRDLRGKLATLKETAPGVALYPSGKSLDDWGLGPVPFASGPMVSLNVFSKTAEQAEWLLRERPDYLIIHPSLAQRLALHFIERGLAADGLKQVVTVAEMPRLGLDNLCRKAFGAELVDIYSAREAGYLALQCPEEKRYHVQSEGVFLELVGADGRACAPGETGRVVVTPLHNFAMPLLRYELGDAAELDPAPCPCGRGLPVLKRILGRVQEMLRLPGGEERWPLLSAKDLAALLAAAPIRQYQIAQRAPDEIELRLVTASPLEAGEEDALRRWVRKKFAYPFAVSLAYFDDLPLARGGKFPDFVVDFRR